MNKIEQDLLVEIVALGGVYPKTDFQRELLKQLEEAGFVTSIQEPTKRPGLPLPPRRYILTEHGERFVASLRK